METELDPRDLYEPDLSIGHLFEQSWPRFKEHLWLLVGAFAVYAILISLGSDTWDGDTSDGGLMNLVGFVITGPLSAGLYWMMLKVQRDEPVEFADLFAGFKEFGRAFGVYAISSIAMVIGLLLLIVPGIIIAVGLWPGLFLVMDSDRNVTETLKHAWAMTSGHRFQLFLLGLVLFFLVLAGIAALFVGVFFTGALASLVAAAAYEELSLAEVQA